MYLVERLLLAALLGLPFSLKWPGRGRRIMPLMTSVTMSLLGSWRGMQTHQGVLVAATGMLSSLVLLAADSSEQGFLSAGILWIAGAIGLAVGHGLFSLAAAVAFLGLAHLIFSGGRI